MNFNPIAFAMGNKGISVDVLSSLMAVDGGGGVPGSLETSGWCVVNGKATVTGNNANMPAGTTATRIDISPPVNVSSGSNHYFYSGDKLEMAIKVTAVSNRCSFGSYDDSKGTAKSKTGLFTFTSNTQGYTTQIGSDVITWEFTGTERYIRLFPAGNSGGTSSAAYASVEITGIKFNGTVIYGKV